MATGLPVIATRHGGIPELVIPGENGDLVPERDPVALAASIARSMDDPSSWARLGRAGRAKVVTEYERGNILEKTLDAYRMALARGEDRMIESRATVIVTQRERFGMTEELLDSLYDNTPGVRVIYVDGNSPRRVADTSGGRRPRAASR